MNNRLTVLLIVFFVVSGCGLRRVEQLNNIASLQPTREQKSTRPVVHIGTAQVTVDIADDPLEHTQGFSGREALGDNEGMLFIFDQPTVQNFWMKDMNFPLDMIWIRDEVVVGISADVPVLENGQITRRSSGEPADMVLEVNAGWSARNGVTIGDAPAFFGGFN